MLWKAPAQVRPAVLAARVREVLAIDVVEQFKACTVPIVYFRGQHDRLVLRHTLRTLLRHRPSLEVVTFPTSHMVLQIVPDAAAILDRILHHAEIVSITGKSYPLRN